ncbi:hypothetical protein F4X33_11735 [Candidatus Poribacteria bacterium]|nr:hypothetical protein [Candidatus Poribacteria bacterium]
MIHKQIGAALITILVCALFCQPSAASAESSEAAQLYETAFGLIVEGDYGDAYDRLNEVIDRYPNTVYARFAEDRKQRLEQLNLPSIRRKKIDQSGRVGAVVFSTLYSTWLGFGTARLIDETDNAKTIAGGLMIGAPAGLLTSLVVTRNAKLTRGQSSLISFGGTWGTWQGLGWSILIDEDDDDKSLIRGAMIGGLSGILATSVLTRRIDPSLGDTGIINYGALWGTWLSMCSGQVAGVEGGDELLAWTLIGGNIGAITMASLSPKIDITSARAHWINLGGVIGTTVASGIVVIIAEDEISAEAAFGLLMVGGIAGLITGIYNTRQIPPLEAGERLSRRNNSTSWDRPPHQLQLNSDGVQVNFLNVQF